MRHSRRADYASTIPPAAPRRRRECTSELTLCVTRFGQSPWHLQNKVMQDVVQRVENLTDELHKVQATLALDRGADGPSQQRRVDPIQSPRQSLHAGL